jgi:hypothetical protein
MKNPFESKTTKVDPEERFQIGCLGCYDIDAAKRVIANHPRPKVPADVCRWVTAGEKRHLLPTSSKGISKADYTVPIIIATVDRSSGNYLIIDGWHRLLNAKRDGVEAIPAFCLTERETIGVFRLPEQAPCLCSWSQR